jgi:hypothetical protein
VTAHQVVRVVGPSPVRGLLTGSPVGPGNWRMSPGQSDAIVSDNHTMGACHHETMGGYFHDFEATWAGHFVCESVRHEYRPLILAAPRLLAILRDAVASATERRRRSLEAADYHSAEPLQPWMLDAELLIARIDAGLPPAGSGGL